MKVTRGDRIRVVRGPLKGQVGTVVEIGTLAWQGIDVKLDSRPTIASLRPDEIALVDAEGASVRLEVVTSSATVRHLQFVGGGSSKFWSIRRRGTANEVHFGRIGTAGQRKKRDFEDDVEAEQAYQRLIAEKLREGYLEAPAPPPIGDVSDGTIEQKLDALADCGFVLRPEYSLADLESSWGPEKLSKPGWNMALICLGMQDEESEEFHSDNLWHFDAECIEDNGDYVRVAERLAEMTSGSLVLTDVSDDVDISAGHASVDLVCNGQPSHVACAVADDWVDPQFLSHFVRLLSQHDPSKVYLYFNLGGQDCIIGCATREQFIQLQSLIPGIELLK